MLRCARGGDDSHDTRHPASSNSDSYDSSSTGSDAGHISKKTNKECTLRCACLCCRTDGKGHEGHKSKNRVSSRRRKNRKGTGLQHLQGMDDKFGICNQCTSVACSGNKTYRKDQWNKHHAKRWKIKHVDPVLDCSRKALSGDACHDDLLDLTLGRQKPVKLVGDHHDSKKRLPEFTEESTCRREKHPNLNPSNPIQEISTSNLVFTQKEGCFIGTFQGNVVLIDKGSITDGENFTQTPIRSALSIQSAEKFEQSLLGSGIEESVICKCKEAEASGLLTPQAVVQRTYEQSNYVNSCYEHLQMETKHFQKKTKGFDLNVAADDQSMLDASPTSALQSSILERSPEDFKSLAPPNDHAICKSDQIVLEANELGISEDISDKFHAACQTLAIPEQLTKCRARRRLFSTNEESHFQRVSLPDPEKRHKEVTEASFSETQDKDIKMNEDPQEMEFQGKEKEQECLKIEPRATEKVVFEEAFSKQDGTTESEQNISRSAPSSEHTAQKDNPLVGSQGTGRKARRKRPICKASLEFISTDGNQKDHGIQVVCATASQQQASSVQGSESKMPPENATFEPPCWDSTIFCELCHRGPSLSLGGWYSCCCGSQLDKCRCNVVLSKPDSNEDSYGGKVHKLCALWSIKAYDEKMSGFEGLQNIVTCGKLLKCARCQKQGATLICVANNCSRVFHYPCADMLASKLRCRMWIAPQFSVACNEHQHDTQLRDGLEIMSPNSKLELKMRQRSSNASKSQPSAGAAECESQSSLLQNKDPIIQISSDNDSDHVSKKICDDSIQLCDSQNYRQQCGSVLNFLLLRKGNTTRRLQYFGNNLLSEDISGGSEALFIPCTNDVDSTPAPSINYIIRSRYLARAKNVYNSLLLKQEIFAPSCKGCSCVDIDDPRGKLSCHHLPIDGHCHSDSRIDWQGQPMFGRLSYDQYGRLQAGPEMDIVECNSRCRCGYACLNNELQKGLRTHLEVFRTNTQEWAVRTTEGIPRGKFVVEFAGEVLTHTEAHKRRGEYKTSQLSCMSSPSHLDGSLEDLLVIDWYRMSNVACFIGHSSRGNLRMHRVYTEVKDARFYSVGLYASHDIEIGERLSYEASNCFSCKHTTINFPLTTTRRSDRLMSSSE